MSSPQELLSYSSIFDPATLVRKGLCPVTKLRHQSLLESHSLYFEQHGTGPEKIFFIMGYVASFMCQPLCVNNDKELDTRLNSSSFAWMTQIEHFARLPGYSSVVFDNRGVGYSGAPRGPYSYVNHAKIDVER
jgi:hypothetical protein